ncbi:hypothetical protein RUND412_004715 [Rhizina undulata]
MSSRTWTEKQTKEVVKKIIRRAEVSRIARVLQHRLALANYKAQNGWEHLTLDIIEPKIDEDLRRKRQLEKTSSPEASFFSEEKNKANGQCKRRASQSSDIGPLPNFGSSRKRLQRTTAELPHQNESAKRHQSRRNNDRTAHSSPGYHYGPRDEYHDIASRELEFQPTFHSSPPRTPPRQILKPSHPNKINGVEGADLLLFLATSPSPAAAIKNRFAPPTTPPSLASALPSSMMETPGAPETPHMGFNFSDFVNITPSPAQGAFGPVARSTSIANAGRKLNFDQLVPPSGTPPIPSGPVQHVGLGVELGDGRCDYFLPLEEAENALEGRLSLYVACR